MIRSREVDCMGLVCEWRGACTITHFDWSDRGRFSLTICIRGKSPCPCLLGFLHRDLFRYYLSHTLLVLGRLHSLSCIYDVLIFSCTHAGYPKSNGATSPYFARRSPWRLASSAKRDGNSRHKPSTLYSAFIRTG